MFFPLDEAEAGLAIGSTVSSAMVVRAAQQIYRLALTHPPLGLPIRALNFHTVRSKSSTLPSDLSFHKIWAATPFSLVRTMRTPPVSSMFCTAATASSAQQPVIVPAVSSTSDSPTYVIVVRSSLNNDEVSCPLHNKRLWLTCRTCGDHSTTTPNHAPELGATPPNAAIPLRLRGSTTKPSSRFIPSHQRKNANPVDRKL